MAKDFAVMAAMVAATSLGDELGGDVLVKDGAQIPRATHPEAPFVARL